MGAIINGIITGFFAAIFVSMYADFLLNYILPVWIIYGILAPLFSAIAITIFLYLQRKKKEQYGVQWWEEKQ